MMRVRHCYVFRFLINDATADVEAKQVSVGLYQKYKPEHCGSAALIHCYQREKPQVVQNDGSIPLVGQPTKGEVGGKFEHDAGAYLVFHVVDGASMVPVDYMVQCLKMIIPDIKLIGKVVLVACAAVGKNDNAANGMSAEGLKAAKELSVLLKMLNELYKEGITPKLVGWDAFITAAPFRPVDYFTQSPVDIYLKSGSRDIATDDELAGKDAGRKIEQGGHHYRFMSDEYRKKYKRVYWIDNNKNVCIVGPTGWSDTPKS